MIFSLPLSVSSLTCLLYLVFHAHTYFSFFSPCTHTHTRTSLSPPPPPLPFPINFPVRHRSHDFFCFVGKVFIRLGLTVPENVVKGVIDMKPGVVEVVLNNIRQKIEQVGRLDGDNYTEEPYERVC